MSCKICGRKPENGTETHWLGCEALFPKVRPAEMDRAPAAGVCEHDECSEPKKEWSGRGAKPKFCTAGHK